MISAARPRSFAIILLLMAAAVFVLSLFRIASYDIWFLLKTGELILDTGTVPTSDPFSHTSFGQPWIMHEWLFCVLAELVRRHLGLPLLVVLKAIAVASAFALVFYTAAIRTKFKRDTLIAIASFLVLAACASRFRFLTRPHIVNFVGLAATVLIVELFFAGRRKWLILLPPLMLVWVNMQAGALIGPAYLWMRLCCDAASSRSGDKSRPKNGSGLRPLLLVTLLSSGVLLINPYGLRVFDFAVAAIWEHGAGGGISVIEWTPPDASLQLFWVLFAAVWIVFLANIKRSRLSDVAELLLASGMTLLARRYIPVFFLLATPALGRIVARWRPFSQDEAPRRRVARIALAGGVLLAGACMAGTLLDHGPFIPGVGMNLGAYPAGGVEFVVKHNISGRMYNSHRFGGYIIFNTYPGRKVFVDGRNVVHRKLWEKFATEPFEQIADEYQIDYAILDLGYDRRLRMFSAQSARTASRSPASPSAARLVDWWCRHNGWHLVFWDDNCAVYVDGSEKFRDVLDQFEYRFLDPTQPGLDYLTRYLADEKTCALVIDEAERAINQSPNAISCRALHAYLAASQSNSQTDPLN